MPKLIQSVTTANETPPVAKVERVAKVEEVEEETPYSLAASREGLGELSPVLKDVDGNVIDGFHRLGETPNWHSITVSTIDNPVKLELARLAVNFNRRKVSPEELSQRITFLVKSGLKPDEIAKQTGISKATIYKYMPQEYKDPSRVESGSKRANLPPSTEFDKRKDSEEALPHTVAIPDADSAVPIKPRVRTFAEAALEAAASTVKVAENSFVAGEVEDEVVPEVEDLIPEGTPICPCCNSSLDPVEFEQMKKDVARKFGKSIQMLLFPEGA
jgi:hypothetical protein